MSHQPEPEQGTYSPTPPSELLNRAMRRSDALRRRRLVVVGGPLVVVIALVLGGVLLTGPGKTGPGKARPGKAGPGTPHVAGKVFVADRIGAADELMGSASKMSPASPAVAKQVEKAEAGFSLRLLDQLSSTNPSANVLVSPSSLATALAMLELGSAGSTKTEIASTLGTAGLTPDQQAAGWHTLVGLLAAETSSTGADPSKVPQLDVANGLWIQKGFAVESQFVDSLASGFGSGVWQADFANGLPAAVSALNTWASEHTDGLIKQMFSPGGIDSSTVLVLANAVYFHADWANQFQAQEQNETFHLAGGATEAIPFMSSSSSAPIAGYAGGSRSYTGVRLPYVGKRLSAVILMPMTETLPRFAASLTAASLQKMVDKMQATSLTDLQMPSFTMTADTALNSPLQSMGMGAAFGPSADFLAINRRVALQVQTVEQHAYLKVTPEGTTAAAVTAIGVEIVSAREERLVIDHPFLFLIRDDATGAILFEAMVENPAAG